MIVSDKQIKTLAELCHIHKFFNMGIADKPWKELEELDRDKLVAATKDVISNLEKIGLFVVPDVGKVRPRHALEEQLLTSHIKTFIETKVKQPVGLVGIFPCGELAHDIVKEFNV